MLNRVKVYMGFIALLCVVYNCITLFNLKQSINKAYSKVLVIEGEQPHIVGWEKIGEGAYLNSQLDEYSLIDLMRFLSETSNFRCQSLLYKNGSFAVNGMETTNRRYENNAN